MNKQNVYYLNHATGEITDDRECADGWYLDGVDIGHLYYSRVFGEWVELMTREA